jgi:myo-inositol 2-dehydrogenase / D-chiro-inositol 1-dehydrogenase
MRFALIGYGSWGRFHARSIAELDGLELTAIACHSEATAAAARKDFPAVRVTRDWRDAIADRHVDVVDVVLPNHLHAAVGCAALAAGKDVLLEKPMAITEDDCDRLIAAERSSGRIVSVGHEFRQSTQWGRAKRLIDEGAIGTPLFVNINLFRNAYRQGAEGWRHDRSRVGSWILEEAVHFFDLAMWYLAAQGDPVSVRAFANQRLERGTGMYDNFSAFVRFAGGAYATITQCIAGFEHHLVVEITGTDGAIRTAWSGTMDRDHHPVYEFAVQPKGFAFERGVREAQHESIAISGEVYELKEQIRLTAQALRERRPLVSSAEARKRVICCVEAERSAREDREIALSFHGRSRHVH